MKRTPSTSHDSIRPPFLLAGACLVVLVILGIVIINLTNQLQREETDVSRINIKNSEVLALTATNPNQVFEVNAAAVFNRDVFLKGVEISQLFTPHDENDVPVMDISLGSGRVFASNLVYSLQGERGDLSLNAGQGIGVSGLVITNTDPGSDQLVFKHFRIGQETISADNNNDSVSIEAGENIILSADPDSKTMTISAKTIDVHDPVILDGHNYLTINGQRITVGLVNLNDHTSGTLAVEKGGTGASELSDITGTDNQISVLNGTSKIIGGNVKLQLPQDIHIGATPTFNGLTLATLNVSGATTFNAVDYNWPGQDGSDDYVLSTDGAGNLIWQSVAGIGGMSSFNVSDGTNSQSIGDGQTLQILGDAGIISTVSPTRTVTVTLDTSYADNRYVNITGDTMTGALNLPSNGLAVGTNQLVVSGGNVGIGTSTPSVRKLHIANDGDVGLRFDRTGAGQHDWDLVASAGDFFIKGGGDGAPSNFLVIKSSGNIGIGSVNPASLLVATKNNFGGNAAWTATIDSATSDATTFPLVLRNSSADNLFNVRSDGNVGIGMASPQRLLDVQASGSSAVLRVMTSSSGEARLELQPRGPHTDSFTTHHAGVFSEAIAGDARRKNLVLYNSSQTEQNAPRLVISYTGRVSIPDSSTPESGNKLGPFLSTSQTGIMSAALSDYFHTTSLISTSGEVNSNTALTLRGTDIVLTDNSSTSANRLVGLHVDVAGGSNSNAIRYAAILAGGNVGIGTTSPTAQLQIHTSSASKVAQIIRGAASQTANLTEWQDSAGGVGARVDSALNFSRPNGTNSEQFGAGATTDGRTNVTVLGANAAYNGNVSGGAVIIGSGATGEQLSVAIGSSASASNSNVAIGRNVNATQFGSVIVGSSASATGQGGTAVGASASAGDGVYATAIGNNAAARAGSVAIGRSADAKGTTVFSVGSVAIGQGVIANQQSIAIGNGAVSTAANQFVAGGGNWDVSNVFIGGGVTASTPLSVTYNATGGSGTDVAGAALQFAGGRGTGTGAGGAIVFQTAAAGSSGSVLNALSERMRIDSNGNIGIGTTSPSAQLQVHTSSASKVAQIIRGAASQSANLTEWQDSAGSVLASISSDGKRLSLDDNTQAVYIPGGDFTGTLIIGDGGQNLSHVSGSDGQENTFAGLLAGRDNTTGSSNTFFGANAGRGNTTGGNNVFIGRSAGRGNSIGHSNAFVGANAGFSNTTGINNVFFGRSAGLNNTTGNSNAFFGNSAGLNNTTGSSNSFLGSSAGFNNTTGSSNSALGVNAGRYIDDGTTGNETGSNSLFLGRDTKALADGQTNQIVIGHDATGLGSNTVVLGNDDIVTTALKGDVGIGITSPDERLHVAGKVKINTFDAGSGSAVCFNASNVLVDCSASSSAFKTNVATMDSVTDDVMNLRPVTFTWKENGQADFGFIAQEVAEVNPLYATFKDGQPHGVRYSKITAVLAKAIQEQHGRIEKLEEKVAGLTAKSSGTEDNGLNSLLSDETEFLKTVTIREDLVVFGSLVVDTIEVATALNVHGNTTIWGDITVKGELVLSSKQGGFVTVPAGEDEVEVEFEKPFKERPVINATPRGLIEYDWGIVEDTEAGFIIKLKEALADDIEFSWTAFRVE